MLLVILRMAFGVQLLNGGLRHLLLGQTAFYNSTYGSGTAIGQWAAANAGIMWPLVSMSMILTGISLIFGIFARLGSIAQFLFALFFILGMNSWMGNLMMLSVALGFIIIGPGRYYGIDIYLLERFKFLKIFA